MTATAPRRPTPPATRLKQGQHLALTARLLQTQDDGVMVVRGIANDANETDSYGTRIKFSDAALEGFRANPVLLYSHTPEEPIGKVRSIAYEGSKLACEVEIFAGVRTPNGTDIQELVKRGALNGFSIRFDDYKTRNTGDYVQIDADVLDELSLVSLPSNRASLITLRSRGVELHGAAQFIDAHPQAPVDFRTASPTRAAGPLSLDLLTQRLSEAIREGRSESNEDRWYYGGTAYLVSVYDDFVVWTQYGETCFFAEGYAVDGGGLVTLAGDVREVIPSWTEVVTVVEDGTRAQAQPTARPAPATRAAPETPTLPATPPAPVAAESTADPEADIPLDQGIEQVRAAIVDAAAQARDAVTPVPETDIAEVRRALREALTPPPTPTGAAPADPVGSA